MAIRATERAVTEAALKLPRKSRASVADKLFQSLVDKDVLIAGAKLAEERWQALKRGEVGAKPARQALRALVERKRRNA